MFFLWIAHASELRLGFERVHLHDEFLDDALQSMSIAVPRSNQPELKGILQSGRPPISGEMLSIAHEMNAQIKLEEKRDFNNEQLVTFLICVAAVLKVQYDEITTLCRSENDFPRLKENNNIICDLSGAQLYGRYTAQMNERYFMTFTNTHVFINPEDKPKLPGFNLNVLFFGDILTAYGIMKKHWQETFKKKLTTTPEAQPRNVVLNSLELAQHCAPHIQAPVE